MRQKNPSGTLKRWLAEHKCGESEGCLLWPFVRNSKGYALMHHEGKIRSVSRVLCEKRHGPPPSPIHHAAHSCGRGRDGCVNEFHVSWKTPRENAADKIIHGTTNRGERYGAAKLTTNAVYEIRRLISLGVNHREIARLHNISYPTVSNIKSRYTWAHLP